VHKRDKEKCRVCGRYVNGTGQIHHLFRRNATIPPDYGIPWVPRNNHPYNLILVCPECHLKIHRGLEIDKDFFIEQNKKKKLTKGIRKWVEENEVGKLGSGADSG
jgi:5-methylcytosine-specific restriction endonuclease McrA